MPLNMDVFKAQFERFKTVVEEEYGAPFVSFQDDPFRKEEEYKLIVRQQARQLLGLDQWRKADVGSGEILDSVIKATRVKRNNLVSWQTQDKNPLVTARRKPTKVRPFEELLFAFFRGQSEPKRAFEGFCELAGALYPLTAFLFFLRDANSFMPIRPKRMDGGFRLLEMPIVTTNKCSWDNYVKYNKALSEIQTALRTLPGLTESRLIDAHSFCFFLTAFDDGGEDSEPSREDIEELVDPFDPSDYHDGRTRVLASIVQRQGRPEFREALLEAYGGACAVTGCSVQAVLEAAHIRPYRGKATNRVTNGILLRADLHTLFDQDLIKIDPDSYAIVIDSSLAASCYAELAGQRIRLPSTPGARPSRESLRKRGLKPARSD